MKYIVTDYDIPYYNMALEEYLLGSDRFSDCIFFYVHRPSIIIGKHQNAYGEVNLRFVRENGIYVSRRLSGGGAVYHDEGNLNFSFIAEKKGAYTVDFSYFTAPVIGLLRDLGADASLSGRNDICIGDRKFSGNAQCVTSSKVLHHGTLMFDVDVEKMTEALNVSDMKLSSHAVKSVRSRVVNLSEILDVDIPKFRRMLLERLALAGDLEVYELTDEDRNEVERKVREKFSLDSYNYGTPKPFAAVRKKKFPAGLIEASFDIENGTVKRFSLSGDFFTNTEESDPGTVMEGAPFVVEGFLRWAEQHGFDGKVVNFTSRDLTELVFG